MAANPVRRALHLVMAFALVLSQLMLLAPSTAVAAPTVVVDSVGDDGDANPGDGFCDTIAGAGDECTLRAAIEEANASAAVDEILFDIPVGESGDGGATYLIAPTDGLPEVTATVTIDASTQPGYVDEPIVILDGSGIPGSGDWPDGLLVEANDSVIRGLVIRGFHDDGIELHGDGNVVVGNHITGNDDGVLVENGTDNVIGGTATGDRNVISGNDDSGISVDRGHRTRIYGNLVGLSADGSSADSNAGYGIEIWGGTTDALVGAGNVISGNGADGIHISDGAADAVVSGSHIGTNETGASAVANDGTGIRIAGGVTNVVVGPGNVISGNTGHGVHVEGGSSISIVKNRIGTNASGSAAVPNGGDGVYVDADDVLIEDNQVSGNLGNGLRLEQEGAIVVGNLVGTDADGTGDVGNGLNGIRTGSGTTGSDIGGLDPGDGNVIAFNASNGVSLRVFIDTQSAIVANSIFANGLLGIDLREDGPTANDTDPPVDADTGPNDLLNHPEIIAAEQVASDVVVEFALPVPDGHYRVEFFLNPSGPNPSGYYEGEELVSSTSVEQTGGDVFLHTFPGSAGGVITATATRCLSPACSSFDVTSEFSTGVTIDPGNRTPILDPVAPISSDEEVDISFTATASDPDGDDLTFELGDGPDVVPTGATIDPDSGLFTWTPAEDQGPAVYEFEIRVTDDGVLGSGTPVPLTDTQTITITVNEVNRPPLLADPGDHTIPEAAFFTFTATATDPDQPANTLTYSLDGAPPGAAIDPNTGVFTWTPTEAQGPIAYTFDVAVTDGIVTITEPVNISVTEVNEPPALTNPGDQSHAEADTIDLPVTATDPDQPANSLTYTAAGLPPGLNIDPNTGQITGTITYTAAATSPHEVTVTVTDNGTPSLTDQIAFTWVTDNTNRPPNLNTITNKTTNEQTTLTFTATATDPDPDTSLTYSLDGAPPGAAINPNTGVFTWTPTEAQGPNTYTLDIRTNDNDPTTPLTDTQTITITVNEVNRPPQAADDSASTLEDTPVGIPVLANDSDEDLPLNRLRVSGVSAPVAGGSVDITAHGIIYSPPDDFHGTALLTYTLSDGSDTDSASVSIDIRPVNDAPVAGDDEFRLSTYQPTELDILANDVDADGDPLAISLKGPVPRELTLEGNTVTFDAISGWIGSVSFDYVIHDPTGASSSATVEVIVGNEVLVGAQRLADQLGADLVSFNPPSPTFEADGLSLIHLDGMTLLADSFFQTVDALRIPLGFLGVTMVMVVGLGATSDVPALVFATRRRHWAVVRLGREQRLPAYSEPGGRKVVYNYDPTAAAIVSLGKTRKVGNTEWVPVETPNGKAWIYRQYLTEHVDLHAFADDPRPARLVHELARRLRTGRSISSLVSDEGLVVALTGSPSQIAPDDLAALMGDRRLRHLPGIGRAVNTPEEFTLAVARPFLEAYSATPEVTADTPHSRSALIPTECWNFPYLAFGLDHGVQPWLVFFEYRNGRAFIAGLGIDE